MTHFSFEQLTLTQINLKSPGASYEEKSIDPCLVKGCLLLKS